MARSILAAMPVALPVFVMALALLLSAPPCLGAAAAAGSAKGTTTSGTAAGRQATVQQHQLSTPRVLLPAVSAALETIRYNLSASGGCYLWASRRPDVVQVHSHAGSGQEIRCDVAIAPITRLDIVTSSRTVFVDDAPEVLMVNGYDEEGNTFTTLDSLMFRWQFLPPNCKPGTGAYASSLEPTQFESSSYDAPSSIYELERKSKKGHILLTNAIKTGRTCVQAHLTQPLTQDAELVSEVVITVVERLDLVPPLVYIVPQQDITYYVRRNLADPVPATKGNTPYSLRVDNSSVAVPTAATGTVKGAAIGSTIVRLVDQEHLLDAYNQPTSFLSVVTPAHVAIGIETCGAFDSASLCILEVDRTYDATLQLYSQDGHLIYWENLLFKMDLDKAIVSVQHTSRNGSWHLIAAKKTGKVTAVGHYLGLAGSKADKPILTCEREIVVHDRITVQPDPLVFPWHPTDQGAGFQMTALGGSGKYNWLMASDNRIASVNDSGWMVPHHFGTTVIVAQDVAKAIHTGDADVRIEAPHSLHIMPGPREVPNNNTLVLSVQFTNEQGKAYTHCKHLEPVWHLRTKAGLRAPFRIVDHHAPAAAGCPAAACACIVLEAQHVGDTEVEVAWHHLTASTAVRAYDPISIHVDDRRLLLTLGASAGLRIHGGPLPYTDDRSAHFLQLSPEKPSALVHQPRSLNEPGFEMTCLALGCQKLTVRGGNKASKRHPEPVVDEAYGELCCLHPASVSLALDASAPVGGSACPSQQDKTLLVANGRHMALRATPLAQDGRRFTNHSTAHFAWTSESLDSSVATLTMLVPAEPADLAGADEGLVSLGHGEGRGRVTVAVHGPGQDKTCQDALTLRMVLPAAVVPPEARLFHHPNASATHAVQHGSGVFLATAETAVVGVALNGRSLQLRARTAGQTVVHVADVCIVPKLDLAVVAHVFPVAAIRVHMYDKVELSKSVIAVVCAMDETETEFPDNQYATIDLQSHVEDGLVSVKPLKTPNAAAAADAPCRGRHFEVTGVAVGLSMVKFSAYAAPKQGQPQRVYSIDNPLQVFAALRLMPRRLLLLPTACHQIKVAGGPSLGDIVWRFHVGNTSVATAEEAGGLVCGVAVGTTRLVATVHTLRGGKAAALLARDEIVVEVARMTGLALELPSAHLVAGEEVVVHAQPLYRSEPIYGARDLLFSWETSNEDALAVTCVHNRDLPACQVSLFTALLSMVGAGHGIITVSTVCDPKVCSADANLLRATLLLTVIERLRLLSGHAMLFHHAIQLPVGGLGNIKTNFGSQKKGLSFNLLNGGTRAGGQAAAVSSAGSVSAGSRPGLSVVQVHFQAFEVQQTEAISLRVAYVSHLSLIPVNDCSNLPIGATCTIALHLHDDAGRRFDSNEGVNILYDVDMPQVVRVRLAPGNAELEVTGMSEGRAVIDVIASSHNGAPVTNYLPINVESGLAPGHAIVPPGTRVCFRPRSVEWSYRKDLSWRSSDRSVATFDKSECATAHQPGVATIQVQDAANHKTQTVLKVAPLASAEAVLPAACGALTNANTMQPTTILIRGYQTSGARFLLDGGDGFINMFTPSCSMAEPYASLFQLTASFDAAKGEYMCIVAPRSQERAEYLPPKAVAIVLALTTLNGQQTASTTLELPFVPAFSVSTRVTRLTPIIRTANLILTGLYDVEHLLVQVGHASVPPAKRISNHNLLKWSLGSFALKQIRPPAGAEVQPGEVHLAVLLGHYTEEARGNYTITLRHGITGQVKTVEVRVSQEGKAESAPDESSDGGTAQSARAAGRRVASGLHTNVLLIIAIVLLVVLVVMATTLLRGQATATQLNASMASAADMTATPERPSPRYDTASSTRRVTPLRRRTGAFEQ